MRLKRNSNNKAEVMMAMRLRRNSDNEAKIIVAMKSKALILTNS